MVSLSEDLVSVLRDNDILSFQPGKMARKQDTEERSARQRNSSGKERRENGKLEFSFPLIFGLGLRTQLHLCLIHFKTGLKIA